MTQPTRKLVCLGGEVLARSIVCFRKRRELSFEAEVMLKLEFVDVSVKITDNYYHGEVSQKG